jgi:hypothetical protein
VQSNDPNLPRGTVRFGKRTTGQSVNLRDAQFYGLLDDIAVFNRALTTSEIQNLAVQVQQLTGDESGLLAGYTFDDGSQRLQLNRALKLNSPAQAVAISASHNNTLDAAALTMPAQQTEMTLPFPPGEAWVVVQGNDSPAGGSHNGVASFCWDFVPEGKPAAGAPFYAAGPGEVIQVIQEQPRWTSRLLVGLPGNQIAVQQAPGEIAGYTHLQQNSSSVALGNSVERGQQLALSGDTGTPLGNYHLHFGTVDMLDLNKFVTFPIAFSNYEVRGANGNWNLVSRGMPQAGQVVRNAQPHYAQGKSTVTYTNAEGKQMIYSFGQGKNGHLVARYWDGNSWHWADQGVPAGMSAIYSPNAVVYHGGASPLIYVFCTASNGHLVVNYGAGSSWQWADQGLPNGTTAVYNPNAITYGSRAEKIHIFGTASNGHVVVNFWDGSWHWADQGLPTGATEVNNPSALTPDGQQLYAFGTTNTGHLVVNRWDGSSWLWEDHGTSPYSGGVYSPNAIAYDGGGSRQVYVFCTGNNGHLVVNYGAGSSWTWADQGRPMGATAVYLPSAVTYGHSGLYVFGTSNTGDLVVNYFDSVGWHWADQGLPQGATAVGNASAIAYGESLYVFGTNSGHLFVDYWDGAWHWADQGIL